MDNCCQAKAEELDIIRERQAATLWAVLVINAVMFGGELTMGLLAGSTSVLADSLDMLGDALVYGFSLYVVGRSLRWRAGAALVKGGLMGLFGVVVLVQAVHHLVSGAVPDFRLMGVAGVLALGANLFCLFLLTRHRHDDINMRSTWLCSRNDIIANLGILTGGALVFATGSPWPDVAIGFLILAVFVRSAALVLRQSLTELRMPREVVHWQPLPLTLTRPRTHPPSGEDG